MTSSTLSGTHSTPIITFGSGTSSTWLGAMCAVSANQCWAIRLSTCPLLGIVVMTRSNALSRSLTTMMRRPSPVM